MMSNSANKYKRQDIADLLFHDKPQKRERWMEIFQNPIWKPLFNVPLEAHRQLAYDQLKTVIKSGIVSVLNFYDDPTNIFTSHEMMGSVSGSSTTKFTVHMNLFGGSIVALCTERHKWIFEKLDKLEITGCFCLTELGFGNNAVEMEATCTYDEKAKEFVIDTPTTLSQKYWITNGAIHADYALVFGQTIVKGKNQGVNAFLVRIRDEKKMEMPGVEIADMGIKMGLNGVDNATLKFHNVRVPRQAMMNKYCDVNEKGQFKSDIKSIQARFFKVTERLLSGRLCLASMNLGSLKTCIYVAVSYAKKRLGVSPNGKSETPIFDYQLQKNVLIPIIARTLGLNMLHNFAKMAFAEQGKHPNDLIMICCADKTLIGWHAERSITLMRERCGGQGYLAANMFSQGIAGAHAALTAEGDNRVLMIKVVKDMLTMFRNNPDFFYNGEFIKVTKNQQLMEIKTLVQLFEMREKHLLTSIISRMMELAAEGYSKYDILMKNVSDEVQALALAYAEKLAIRQCMVSLEKLDAGSQKILLKYFRIFAWEIIIRDMPLFIFEEWICPQICKMLRLSYNELIKDAANDIDVIVSSLNVPTHAIYAPIANDYVKYNEKAYLGEVINAKM